MNREEQVEPFLDMVGVPYDVTPENVELKFRELAIALIFEESCAELAEASGVEHKLYDLCKDYMAKYEKIRHTMLPIPVDKIKQIDALADAQYVLSWAINVLGHKNHFQAAYDEVCRSNNSKSCQTKEIAQATADTLPIETIIEEKANGSYLVKRKSDGKLIKSLEYSPANFKQFFK